MQLPAFLTTLADQGPNFYLASACCAYQKMVAGVIGVTVRNNACEIKSARLVSFFLKEEICLRNFSTSLLSYIVGWNYITCLHLNSGGKEYRISITYS